MKLNRAELRFLDKFYPGRLSYVITLDVMGYDTSEADLAKEASQHDFVVINGDEPFKQKDQIKDLVNGILKHNSQAKVTIFTDGNIKSVGLNKFGSFNNIEYIINGKLKNSRIPYNERVNEGSWKWYAIAGAKFIFNIYNKEELEEILMLMDITTLKPSQVYLNIHDGDFKDIVFESKLKGFNIYFEAHPSMFE